MFHCHTRIHRRSGQPTIRSTCCATGCTLSRRQDRRYPQSPRPYNCHSTAVTANRVASLRTHWETRASRGNSKTGRRVLTIEKQHALLASHPLLCIAGSTLASLPEQITGGRLAHPSQPRVAVALVERAPEGYAKMFKAMNHSVSHANHLAACKARRTQGCSRLSADGKGIRIQVPAAIELFDPSKTRRCGVKKASKNSDVGVTSSSPLGSQCRPRALSRYIRRCERACPHHRNRQGQIEVIFKWT